MSRITKLDIIKLASSSGKLREAMLELSKKAAEEKSEFNESVPAADEQTKTDEKKEEVEKKPVEQPPQEQMAQEQAAVAPAEGPGEIGARAARAFIGPEVFQSALSGDIGAQDLIARMAGQVAGSVADTASKVLSQQQAPAQEAVVPAVDQQQVAAMPQGGVQETPEDQIANEIVPPVQDTAKPEQGQPVQEAQPGEQPAQEKGNMPEGKQQVVSPDPGAVTQASEGEKIDINDVKRLLELAKSGKI